MIVVTKERSLAETIRDFVEEGWQLTFRDRNMAQLVSPKRVNLGLMLFPLVYVLVWLATREGQAYLEENGAKTEYVVHEGGLPIFGGIIAAFLAFAQLVAIIWLVGLAQSSPA